MIKKCSICDKEFETNQPMSKYCSKECRFKANTLRVSKKKKEQFYKEGNIKTCLVCGNEFEVTQQHRHQKYCSKKCSRKSERLYGDKRTTDLEYKDKMRFGGNRDKALDRDNYECQMCGNKNSLIVHHKDCSGQTDAPNNELDNLVTLCRRCHINIHRII